MAKRLFHPYMRPIIRGYEDRKFLARSAVIMQFLRDSLLKKVSRVEDKDWIVVLSKKRFAKMSSGPWMPKIYVCVQPQDYWSVVADLIPLSQKLNFNWKFCKNERYAGRPDKIIIYSRDLNDVKRIVRVIRPMLAGKKFHALEFASTTVQAGLEKKGEGIYVGSDPCFLGKQTSCGYYRWAVNESVIKQNKRRGGVSADVRAVLKKLNVSLKHAGPVTLIPDPRHNSFIRQLWKEINS